jgi:tetratricopeptide (TPR) repeat protein
MRALEKDRVRRYASASELGADIGRHLANEPVLAGPPSASYRITKFAQRHAMAVGVAALVLVLLIGFSVTLAVQATRIARERDRANQEASTAEQTVDFLLNMFDVSDPSTSRGEEVTARELLDRGAAKIQTELQGQPLVQARLKDVIGRVYFRLGYYDLARPLLEDAVEIRQELLGDHHDTFLSLGHYCHLLAYSGERERALEIAEDVMPKLERLLGPDHIEVAKLSQGLANLLRFKEPERARQLFERAIGVYEKEGGIALGLGLNDYALMLARSGEPDKAQPLYERALQVLTDEPGLPHPAIAGIFLNLGGIYKQRREYDKALEYFEESIERWSLTHGEHRVLVNPYWQLAMTHAKKGDYEKAKPMIDRVLELKLQWSPPSDSNMAQAIRYKSFILESLGKFDEARRHNEQMLAFLEEELGADHVSLAAPLQGLALERARLNDHEGAKLLYERLLRIEEKREQPDHEKTVGTVRALAEVQTRLGAHGEAQRMYQRLVELETGTHGADSSEVTAAVFRLAGAFRAGGDSTAADREYRRAQEYAERLSGVEISEYAYSMACYHALFDRPEEALHHLRRAVGLGLDDDWLSRDPDLKTLHGNPEFEALVAQVRKQLDEELDDHSENDRR